jgi:hypothetical protein
MAYAIASNRSALNSLPPNPWIVSNGAYILEPSMSMCVGTVTACINQSQSQGVTKILTPILISQNWLIDQVPTGIRLSYIDIPITPASAADESYLSSIHPLIFFNNDGGVLMGPDPALSVKNLLTLTGTPTNTVVNGMWQSTSSMAFRDPDPSKPTSFIDTVCHVLNASICGKLFRSSKDDPGLFWSANRVIFGLVDYGVIVANLQSYIIFNSSMVVVDYSNYGAAVPCIPNPSMEAPESKNLWVDIYTSTTGCKVYTERIPSAVPTSTCVQASTVPVQLLSNTSAQYIFTTINQTDFVNVTGYSDSQCSALVQTTSYQLGCSAISGNSYVYFRMNIAP